MHVEKSKLSLPEALTALESYSSSEAEDLVLQDFKPACFKSILLELLHFRIFV